MMRTTLRQFQAPLESGQLPTQHDGSRTSLHRVLFFETVFFFAFSPVRCIVDSLRQLPCLLQLRAAQLRELLVLPAR